MVALSAPVKLGVVHTNDLLPANAADSLQACYFSTGALTIQIRGAAENRIVLAVLRL